MNQVLTGLDRLRMGHWKKLKGHRLGLLSNQASLDSWLTPAKSVIEELLPGHLKVLFGPQHGYTGEDQDNMVETGHAVEKALGIPVFSLYADKREPDDNMLENLETLIIDLQDVGTRVYTFASTMLGCLKAAARNGKKVLVLDRPNPLGGEILEGPILEPAFFSFVGPWSLPMRHGLTMGELAGVFNEVFHLGCDLEILQMDGWKRSMYWKDTGLRWIMPSPNMPHPATAGVYPGQVIWEGTNLSEGRGTCRPFETFGAPFLETSELLDVLDKDAMTGCLMQEFTFRPTFHKWAGELCRGFMIHILDPRSYSPFFLSISLLGAIMDLHKDDFQWKPPPYEYEFDRKPIDLILGNGSIRHDLEVGTPPSVLRKSWGKKNEAFSNWRRPHLLY